MAIGGSPIQKDARQIIVATPERKLSLVPDTDPACVIAPTPSQGVRGCPAGASTVAAYPWPIGAPQPRLARPTRIGPFTIGDKIGEGSCATVRRAHRTGYSPVQYACKVLPRSTKCANDSSVLNAEREITLHRLCASKGHPNIVGIEAVAGDDNSHYVFQHLASDGDLFDLLDKLRSNPTEREVALFFKGILSGLAHCHAAGVAHRDIKVENVLLEKSGGGTGGFGLRPMLCDFGFATTDQWSSDACGTLDYAAPEVLKAKLRPYQPRKADVWSAGVVLYVVLVGALPFESASGNKREIRQRIMKAAFDMPSHLSEKARELLGMMLNPDPDARADAEECLRAPFFAIN